MISLRDALLMKNGGILSLVGAGGKTSLMFRLAGELASAGESVLTTTTTKILTPTTVQSPCVIRADSCREILHRGETLLKDTLHITAASGDENPDKLKGLPREVIDELSRSDLFRWILVEADGAARMPLKAPAFHEPVIPKYTRLIIGMVGMDALGKPNRVPFVFRPDLYGKVTGIPEGAEVTEHSIAVVLTSNEGILKGAPKNAIRLAFLNKAVDASLIRSGRRIAGFVSQSTPPVINRVVLGCVLEPEPVVDYWDTKERLPNLC